MNYIFHEAKLDDNVCSDSAKYGCIIVKTYGLSCVCLIVEKMKLGSALRMDEVCSYWKRIRFDDDIVMKDSKPNISILTE